MSKLSLEAQMKRFIKSGMKYSQFTNDLYSMLYIDANEFIAHYNKAGFYQARFLTNADKTCALLLQVRKPELKGICHLLAEAIRTQMKTAIKTEVYMTVGGA